MGYCKQRLNRQGHARYTAYYWDLRGRARSAGTFSRKRDAERAWRRAEAETTEGRFVDLASGRQRFGRYVTDTWLPNHTIELNTRQGYEQIITKYLLPGFATMRMNEILPTHIRDHLRQLADDGATAHTLARCKTVLSAIFTTALNDRIVVFHPCSGVTTPAVPKRPLRILTPAEYDALHAALAAARWQLLADLALETGIRWGELAELRTHDLHPASRVLTISRAVVELNQPNTDGTRFVVKHYPKNTEYRQLHLTTELTTALQHHITQHDLVADDLLFGTPTMTPNTHTPSTTPAPAGHGTATRYNTGCRCQHCRTAIATYRHHRRAHGHDRPTRHRRIRHDQHLDRGWFRKNIWYHALADAGLTHPVRIHDLRHTNASWMLAGGADLETIRERLGHRSLRATERYLHTLPHTHNTALTALHRTRTCPPSTPRTGQLTVTNPTPQKTKS
ncbi:tyrosine-type recombinase/integrase [Saccharopolyspora endophytica]|uniref:Tyrosine-type recombinase/integrase family protein n=1 Tax=Saccharopolyspora endophytica TaxID=543886 RepID=A0ABS5DQS4_9PSEU|nr:tyrosine-type recombinase/integrase [Saccharopolyspora endophytica]MBQ0928669.1 tyrosine-type recombinase/integrase family protein [Saccharopolyspora endophytica]